MKTENPQFFVKMSKAEAHEYDYLYKGKLDPSPSFPDANTNIQHV